MRFRKQLIGAVAVVATWLVLGGSAMAAFPNYSGCPTTTPGFEGCINIQGTGGNLNIKGFNVPLLESLEIRGALRNVEDRAVFVPPAGTTGFFGRAIPVPGGLLGIEWIPGNSVLAITELAGSPSSIQFDFETFSIRVPVKVRLVNLLLGMDCHIGTNSRPVVLDLRTTSPGTFTFVPPDQIQVLGNVNGDRAFSVPGATECGLGLGLINSLVNLRLGLPSSSGNNTIEVRNNIGIRLP